MDHRAMGTCTLVEAEGFAGEVQEEVATSVMRVWGITPEILKLITQSPTKLLWSQ
jgi:hypothetical protein